MNNQFERGTVNRLTEKERKAAFRRWTFVAGLGWNYETQQAPSVAFAMSKALRKIYPNDPCPCGSGKKYKKCCGRR